MRTGDVLLALAELDANTELGVYDVESDTELIVETIEDDDGPVLKVRRAA